MKEVKYLLKFGQKEHIQQFVDGNLYCANSKLYRGIEQQQNTKGQGDILEGIFKVFAQNLKAVNRTTGEEISVKDRIVNLEYDGLDKTPIFCMFAVFEDDCINDIEGNISIKLNVETKHIISEHFPNADTVAIINNPTQFCDDLTKHFNNGVKYGLVEYFNISNGLLGIDGKPSIDGRVVQKIIGKELSEVKGRTINVNTSDFQNILFCKDTFFEKQQEFRIILTTAQIENGTTFRIRFTEKPEVMSITDFFNIM